MDAETKEMFQAILSGMEGMEKRLESKIQESETRIKIGRASCRERVSFGV